MNPGGRGRPRERGSGPGTETGGVAGPPDPASSPDAGMRPGEASGAMPLDDGRSDLAGSPSGGGCEAPPRPPETRKLQCKQSFTNHKRTTFRQISWVGP